MELNEFVENALSQLLQGVSAAQSKAAEIGGEINPRINDNNQTKLGFLNSSGLSASIVKFDVALTASEGSGTKAGISVLGGAVNLGAGGQSSNENSVVSRIQFSVPIVLPSSR
ncbi:hypothetical protein LCGC14_2469950 [marine sediment metagenome]|uniref:Uncharacterized protein n=1 Tax=marine sediment metagenome TaxID=412755 RepID=A0A0F9E4Q8_9ZZZZ